MNLIADAFEFEEALIAIDIIEAKKVLDKHFTNKKEMKSIEMIINSSMERIGSKWEKGEVSLSQVYMSGIITEKIIEEYLPLNSSSRIKSPKMAICVLEDSHALGKRIVLSIVRSSGYTIIDFGQGLSADEIVKKALEENIEVLLISTLMYASAIKVKDIRKELDRVNSSMKIIVGGAPFRLNSNLWKEVGAYAKGDNASEIIDILDKVVKL